MAKPAEFNQTTSFICQAWIKSCKKNRWNQTLLIRNETSPIKILECEESKSCWIQTLDRFFSIYVGDNIISYNITKVHISCKKYEATRKRFFKLLRVSELQIYLFMEVKTSSGTTIFSCEYIISCFRNLVNNKDRSISIRICRQTFSMTLQNG